MTISAPAKAAQLRQDGLPDVILNAGGILNGMTRGKKIRI